MDERLQFVASRRGDGGTLPGVWHFPAAANFLQQQARFDKFMEVFNNERPHEALDMMPAPLL
jgi:transposase InsO family protein